MGLARSDNNRLLFYKYGVNMSERAKLVSESLAEEVYALCEDLHISRQMVKHTARGSELWWEHKGRIEEITERLGELGINRIEGKNNEGNR